MKDTDKKQRSSNAALQSQLSPNSHEQIGNVNSLSQWMYHPSMMATLTGELTPEMYAQYAYMYNYMYMQQQVAAGMTGFTPEMYNMNLRTAPYTCNTTTTMAHGDTGASYGCHDTSSPSQNVDNAHAIAKQQQQQKLKTPISPKHRQRYNPYSRTKGSASPVPGNDNAKMSGNIKSLDLENKNSSTSSSGADCVSDKNSLEAPLDLSRKSEKLQYLNTLKQIIESNDRRSNLKSPEHFSHVDNVNTNTKPAILDLSKSSTSNREASSNGTDRSVSPASSIHSRVSASSPILIAPEQDVKGTCSAMKSKEDKLGYLSVLKELFEKGHSKTSQDILYQGRDDTHQRVSDIKCESDSKSVKEEDLDDLSVDQSLVIREDKSC